MPQSKDLPGAYSASGFFVDLATDLAVKGLLLAKYYETGTRKTRRKIGRFPEEFPLFTPAGEKSNCQEEGIWQRRAAVRAVREPGKEQEAGETGNVR